MTAIKKHALTPMTDEELERLGFVLVEQIAQTSVATHTGDEVYKVIRTWRRNLPRD